MQMAKGQELKESTGSFSLPSSHPLSGSRLSSRGLRSQLWGRNLWSTYFHLSSMSPTCSWASDSAQLLHCSSSSLQSYCWQSAPSLPFGRILFNQTSLSSSILIPFWSSGNSWLFSQHHLDLTLIVR